MQKNKTSDVRLYAVPAIAGLILIFFITIFMCRMYYNDYKLQMQILVTMLEEDNDLEIASALLKGRYQQKSYSEDLKNYGYTDNFENHYHKSYKRHVIYTVAAAILTGAAYVTAFYFIYLSVQKHKNKVYNDVNDIIVLFRDGLYDKISFKEAGKAGTAMDGMYAQIESLGNSLQLLQAKMKHEKEETKSLVTDISHQLKTPVAALKACFEILLQNDLKEEERKEFSLRCSQQLSGLENLLSALINISRLETGMIEIRKETLCIFDTFVEALNRVYIKAEKKHIKIEVVSQKGIENLKIPHDKKWLCEAFINILENAVKYSHENSCVTIRFELRTVFLRIEIEDEGIGVPQHEYNQIFKRFYRGGSKQVRTQEGSGIGLYLTRKIISRHEGLITVGAGKGADSKGSIFIIQLPYK